MDYRLEEKIIGRVNKITNSIRTKKRYRQGNNLRLLTRVLSKNKYLNENPSILRDYFHYRNPIVAGLSSSIYMMITKDYSPINKVTYAGLGMIITQDTKIGNIEGDDKLKEISSDYIISKDLIRRKGIRMARRNQREYYKLEINSVNGNYNLSDNKAKVKIGTLTGENNLHDNRGIVIIENNFAYKTAFHNKGYFKVLPKKEEITE